MCVLIKYIVCESLMKIQRFNYESSSFMYENSQKLKLTKKAQKYQKNSFIIYYLPIRNTAESKVLRNKNVLSLGYPKKFCQLLIYKIKNFAQKQKTKENQ